MMAADDDSSESEEFGVRILSCVPDVLLAAFGLNPNVMSAEESSCLRESISDIDLAALMTAPEDSPESNSVHNKVDLLRFGSVHRRRPAAVSR